MIKQYPVRILRPWAPGMERGDEIEVSGRRRAQLRKMNMVEDVQEKKPVEEPAIAAPIKKVAKKRTSKKTAQKRDD